MRCWMLRQTSSVAPAATIFTQSTWISTAAVPVSLSRDVQMIKAGINYKFDSGVSEASRGIEVFS